MDYSLISRHRTAVMGFAALMILLFHFGACLYDSLQIPVLTSVLSCGNIGVDIFRHELDQMADSIIIPREDMQPGDLVLTMGAGDINKVGKLILDMDAARIEAIRKTKIREFKKIED